MALIASCWLLVESFIVPHGFIKWFYLSFYIHPLFLLFCQLFLCFNDLMIFFYPLKVAFRLALFVFGLIVRVVFFLFSYIRPTRADVYYDAVVEPEKIEHISFEDCQIFVFDTSRADESVQVRMNQDGCVVEDSWLNQYLYSDHYSSSALIYDVDTSESMLSDQGRLALQTGLQISWSGRVSKESEVLPDQQKCATSFPSGFMESSHETDQDSAIISPSNSSDLQILENMFQKDGVSPISSLDLNDSLSAGNVLVDKGSLLSCYSSDVEDPFHNKYTSRVRFFDVLYHERLHGINAILNEHLSNPNMFDFVANYPVVWSRMARKRVLRSLECDLEMINVAQSCLFWEALHNQYHKVESLSLSENCGNMLFHHNISGKFQQLQILLERFVENQRCQCQNSSTNITSKRLSFQGLLHVPNATGFVLMEEENKMMSEDDCIRPTQLLEAIDNCIKAFWLYIKTDDQNKPFWKYKGIWRAHPPVEDPQDLELLYNVVKDLRKKGIMLRGVQGKSKCWMRKKVKPMQAEHEKRNILVAMIDVKLVERMLKLSLISRSHLVWCQEKLSNLGFKQNTVFRGCNNQLFPLP